MPCGKNFEIRAAAGCGINREDGDGGRNCDAGAGVIGVIGIKRELSACGGSGAAGGAKKRERMGMGMNRENNGSGGRTACQGMKRLRFGCRKREPLRGGVGRAAVWVSG